MHTEWSPRLVPAPAAFAFIRCIWLEFARATSGEEDRQKNNSSIHNRARKKRRVEATIRKTPKSMFSLCAENACAILAPMGAANTVAGAIHAKPIRLT